MAIIPIDFGKVYLIGDKVRAPRKLCTFILTTFLAIYTANADETSNSTVQPDFCHQLPRPEWSALKPASTDDGWFQIAEVGRGVWAIYEPYQWQEVISYLIVGSQSALLFDTGNGIGDMRSVVTALTDKPVRVLNSHSHYDHVGGNYQFNNILAPAIEFSHKMSAGLPNSAVKDEVAPAALCRELPEGYSADAHRVHQYNITQTVNDGDVIELGDRTLEVLLIPGHTPDSLALIDREHGLLWPGDSFYKGPIWLTAPETNLAAYRASTHRMARLVPDLNAVLPAHNTPREDPERLEELAAAVDAVLSGETHTAIASDDQLEFNFENFSLLTTKVHLKAAARPE